MQKFDSGSVFEYSLSNGMRLVVVPTDARPRVLVQMLYDVGASIEENNEKGLAHLLEHMIFKGTPRLQEGAIWKLAARYGATMNAFTAWDMTSYFFEVDSNNWKPFVAVLADCMENVLLSSEHLASEVKAVIQELRMRNDNPSVVLQEALFERALPQDHPYFVPIIGYKKDLAAMTSKRLKAFYTKYYVPERATLFVVGDVVVDDVVAEVERNFGHMPASGKTFAPVFSKEYPKTIGFHAVLPKHFVKPTTVLAWTIPAVFNDAADVADMAAAVMGEGQQSFLYKRLVDKDQSADMVECGTLRVCNEAFFMVSFQPRDGRLEDCVRAITEELASLSQKGIDSSVLARLVKSTLVQYEMAQENPTRSFLSYDLLTRYIQTGSVEAAFTIGERLSRVTPKKITQFAGEYLTSQLMMRLDTVPMNEAQKEAWKLEQAKEQELEQQILASHVRTTPVLTDVILPDAYADAQPIAVPIPKSTARFTLDNGLKIVVAADQHTNLCSFMLLNGKTRIGTDELVKIKLAIIKNLFIEGAAGATKEELVTWFDDRGVQLNLAGGAAVCLKEDFADVFKKFFAIVRHPDFLKSGLWNSLFGSMRKAEQAFLKIKEQVIQQYKSYYDNPQMIAEFEQVSRRYKDTPFGYSLEALLNGLNDFKFSELPALYDLLMDPAHNVLSIAGNVDSQEVLRLAQEALGDLKALPVEVEKAPVCALEVSNFDVAAVRDQVYIVYIRESKMPVDGLTLDQVAVDVLGLIILGGGTSRLFKLREATGIFYTCGGALRAGISSGFHRTQDTVFAIVSPEKLEEACTLFESFIQTVFRSSISQQELDDARHTLRSRSANAALGVMARANHFAMLDMYKRDESFRQRYLDFLDVLTPQLLEETAARYIADGPFVRVRVGNIKPAS